MKIKHGIIGLGGMGSWHCDNVKAHLSDRMEVVAAYDIRPEVKDHAENKGLKFYENLDDFLASDIDLVTIATPNNFHMPLTVAALNAGKHVICEKPIAMNAGELETMIAAAKTNGKVFACHQNRRWDRDFRIIKSLVDDGSLGKPYFIESRVQGSRRSLVGWRDYAVNGGGMVYDWGIHLIDQIMWMIDSPVVQIAPNLHKVFSREVDDNFKVLFTFENGVSALVEVSTNCFINQPRWHVSFEEGTAIVEDWDCHGKIVKLSDSGEMSWDNDIVYTSAGPTRTMAPRPVHTTKQLELPKVNTDWADYYRNIVDVIAGDAELIVKPEQTLRVMRVIDAIFECDRTGEPIKCRI
ncbi:MAG: Gfo/Idh/MocA family oxidoreductase [Clostridia bacterium]|nr:Gfo/Idh/MocA family oxidoreductase [Clostridia bacterium]